MTAKQAGFLTLLVIPSIFLATLTHAATEPLAAGFAPGTVWLSQSAPTAQSSVRIYTVIYDSSTTSIEGSVAFKVDGTTVGSSPFGLEPGESAIESAVWVPTEGTHSITAEITSAIDKKTKQAIAVSNTSAASLSVSVSPPAPKAPALEAIDSAQTVVASSSPIVASVVAATTATTESIRKAGESYLEGLIGAPQASTTASTTKPRGSVLGASTEVEDASSTPPTEKSGYMQQIAKALLPLFKYPALFYPFFLFLILFVGWIVAKRLRNPKKR